MQRQKIVCLPFVTPFAQGTILESIGNTPLAPLSLLGKISCFAKCEHLNPGGSIKDRSALYMVSKAVEQGKIRKETVIVEASSGNQGIALAMIGKIKGYQTTIFTSEKTSTEKKECIQMYGALLLSYDSKNHSGAHLAFAYAQEHKEAYFVNQYFNEDNKEAHYWGLGPELYKQTAGKITHLFGALGSGGTLCGAAQYLKEQNPFIKIIGADAATSAFSSPTPSSYDTEGIGIDYPEGIIDSSLIDQIVPVTDSQAFGTSLFLARTHGILVGPSSGAAVYAALSYKQYLPKEAVCVIIFADSGRAYLSKMGKYEKDNSCKPEVLFAGI